MTTEPDSLFVPPNDPQGAASDLKIKVIGIGGAGINAVDALQIEGPGDVRLAAVNTDAQTLGHRSIVEKRVIGASVTRGLGAGGEVDIGRAAAESDRAALAGMIAGVDLIILVVGLGGGTGSAVAPVIAELAEQTDALVLAFATLPFSFEGARRKRIAEESLGELRKRVHGLVPLPNDILLQEGEEDSTVLNAFAVADQWVGHGVKALCSILLKTGLINQDFSSLRSVFQHRGGKTLFSTGIAGEDFVSRALDSCLSARCCIWGTGCRNSIVSW